jgi:hypothetical protein
VTVQVIVWGENIIEREDPVVARLYPYGMHTCIADALNAQPGIVAGTATLEEAEHGLTASGSPRPTCWSGGATTRTTASRTTSSSASQSRYGVEWG